MAIFAGVGGQFWLLEYPTVSVRGDFTAAVGEQAEVTLDAGLPIGLIPGGQPPTPAPKPGDMPGVMRAHAAGSAARFRPVTVGGQLGTGEFVTLLNAPNFGGAGFAPRYVAAATVIGETPVASDQTYSAVRFLLDNPIWLGHLTDGDSTVVDDDQSMLSVKSSSEGNWLVYESSSPVTLRQLEIRVVSGCLSLAQLALLPDEDPVIRQTQVRADPGGPWLAVHGPAFCAQHHNGRLDTLLPWTELTVERFARWIEMNDCFDGLAWAVARKIDAPIQLQVQLLTSLVEGFHRRLPSTFKQQWLSDDKDEHKNKEQKAALKRIRKAAIDAAVAEAKSGGQLDHELVRKRVDSALGQLGDRSYRERANDLVDYVLAAVPEIGESVAKLPRLLRDSRIDFAHQLPQPKIDDSKDPFDKRVLRWTALSQVTTWLIRVLLLLQVGIDPQLLHEKCLTHQQFAFFRVNLEQLVRELGWELPSPPEPK
jgi:hypothetical protein